VTRLFRVTNDPIDASLISFSSIVWAYFNWRDRQTHTSLGRDPQTGEVVANPAWYKQGPGVLTQPIS